MHALEAEGSPVTDALCLFATPWWVNLAILVPLVSLCDWWRGGLEIAPRTLVIGAAFGVSFGFVEAAAVVYLRAVIRLYPAGGPAQDLALALLEIPGEPLWIEVLREPATIVMLGSIALLAAQRARALGHVPLRLCRLGPLLLRWVARERRMAVVAACRRRAVSHPGAVDIGHVVSGAGEGDRAGAHRRARLARSSFDL